MDTKFKLGDLVSTTTITDDIFCGGKIIRGQVVGFFGNLYIIEPYVFDSCGFLIFEEESLSPFVPAESPHGPFDE